MIILLVITVIIIIVAIFIYNNNKLKKSRYYKQPTCISHDTISKKNTKCNLNPPTILEKDKLYPSLNQIQTITYPVQDYKWGGCQANKPTKSTKFNYI